MLFTTDGNEAIALNRETGTKIWSFDLGGSSRSSPSYANGIIYIGSHDRNLYALNATTGEKIWNYQTRNSIYSSPTVSNGLVYVGSMDGNIYAIGNKSVSSNPRTHPLSPGGEQVMFRFDSRHSGDYSPVAGRSLSNGQLLWKSRLSYNRWPEASAPTVANGFVFLGSNEFVYALNKKSGDILWAFTAGNMVTSTPAVDNGMVFVGSYDRKLYALDATDGVMIWNYSTGGAISSSPAVSGNTVFVCVRDGNLYAIDKASGTKLWNFTAGSGIESSPAVASGLVFIGSVDGKMNAVDTGSGQKLWNFSTPGSLWSSPSVVNNIVYFGSDDSNVYALNAMTGTKLWNYTTGGRIRSSPAVTNGIIYIGSFDDNLYALNATTGTLIWQNPMSLISSPAFAEWIVYVGGYNTLYALNATTGAIIWTSPADSSISSPSVSDGVVYFTGMFDEAYAVGSQVASTTPVIIDQPVSPIPTIFDNGGDDSPPAIRQSVVFSSETVNVGGDSDIRRINVTGHGVSDIVITGMKKSPVPAGIPVLEDPVYEYIEISPAHYTDISGAIIEFDVPQSWLDEHHANPTSVSLRRFHNNIWELLPTTVLKTSNGRVYLTAECTGFSFFAISIDKNTVTTPEITPMPVSTTMAAMAINGISRIVSPSSTETPVSSPPRQPPPANSLPLPFLIIGPTGIIVVLVGVIIVRRWWIRRQNPALFREYE
jgi:PGF-pre-PGF domain-containing protein